MSTDEPIGDDFAGLPRPAWWFSIRGLMIAVLGVALSLVLFQHLPALQYRCTLTYRTDCASNLRMIGLGLQAYYNAHGYFPPPYVADATGKPIHSWRTLVLPFLDNQDLFEEFKLDEPWGEPNNRKLADVGIGIYHCRELLGYKPGLTGYVLIRGPGTAFPGSGKRVSLADIKDDLSTTIVAVETVEPGIHWAEPRDLDISGMSFKINDSSRPCISSHHAGGANVLMMDGSVKFLSDKLSPATVRALITIDGGELINKGDLDP
jgi:prepilin-type processing-associated H-X9-DG protein